MTTPGTSTHPGPATAATDPTGPTGLTETMSSDTVPTTFGVFKPVGHVMVGLPTEAATDQLVRTLHRTGWASESLLRFVPDNAVAELTELVNQAGPLAGFGFEITVLRRYLALAEQGHRWLLVKADSTEQAAQVAELARRGGAVLAMHYRSLAVEELL